ncbi:hypothetical protein DVA81_19290, partial [Acinetobacter baumannii]
RVAKNTLKLNLNLVLMSLTQMMAYLTSLERLDFASRIQWKNLCWPSSIHIYGSFAVVWSLTKYWTNYMFGLMMALEDGDHQSQ